MIYLTGPSCLPERGVGDSNERQRKKKWRALTESKWPFKIFESNMGKKLGGELKIKPAASGNCTIKLILFNFLQYRFQNLKKPF